MLKENEDKKYIDFKNLGAHNTFCALCKKDPAIQESHIIPSFVYKYLKNVGTGFLRCSQSPNRRMQDGIKTKLLCLNHENQFSKSEKLFCENFFLPFQNDQQIQGYGSWLTEFSISLFWRIAWVYQTLNDINHLSEKQKEILLHTFTNWSEYLLGKEELNGNTEIFFFPLRFIENEGNLSNYYNRYIGSAVDIQIFRAENELFIYAKMGKVLLIGLLEKPTPGHKMGILIDQNGVFSNESRIEFDYKLLMTISKQADKTSKAIGKLSKIQWDKIKKSYEDNSPNIMESDTVKGAFYDNI
jgi:hypothetical protein